MQHLAHTGGAAFAGLHLPSPALPIAIGPHRGEVWSTLAWCLAVYVGAIVVANIAEALIALLAGGDDYTRSNRDFCDALSNAAAKCAASAMILLAALRSGRPAAAWLGLVASRVRGERLIGIVIAMVATPFVWFDVIGPLVGVTAKVLPDLPASRSR